MRVMLLAIALLASSGCSSDQPPPSVLPPRIQAAVASIDAQPNEIAVVRRGEISATSDTPLCSFRSNIIHDEAFRDRLSELGVSRTVYLDSIDEETDARRVCAAPDALWSGGAFQANANAEGYEIVIAFWQGGPESARRFWLAQLVREEDVLDEFAAAIPLGFDPPAPDRMDEDRSSTLEEYRRSLSIWDDQRMILNTFLRDLEEDE